MSLLHTLEAAPSISLGTPGYRGSWICCLDGSRHPLPQFPVPSRQALFQLGSRCHTWLLFLSYATLQ